MGRWNRLPHADATDDAVKNEAKKWMLILEKEVKKDPTMIWEVEVKKKKSYHMIAQENPGPHHDIVRFP